MDVKRLLKSEIEKARVERAKRQDEKHQQDLEAEALFKPVVEAALVLKLSSKNTRRSS